MRTLALAAGLVLMLGTSAFGQTYDLKVHLRSGETVTLSCADIRRIEFANLTTGVTPSSPATPGPLLQFARCWPNPFRPQTTVEYAISARADVRVRVYDLKGAVIRELVNGNVAAGRHQVTWDGTDGHQSRVASGMYFYRIHCGNQTISGRVIRVQ